jgi:hypothetical protein
LVPTSQADESVNDAPKPVISWYRRVVSTVMVGPAGAEPRCQDRPGWWARYVCVPMLVRTTDTPAGSSGAANAVPPVIAIVGSTAASAMPNHRRVIADPP